MSLRETMNIEEAVLEEELGVLEAVVRIRQQLAAKLRSPATI
jgi:hypothetical protein